MPVPPVPAKARLVCAGSVFLAALLLYVRTLAPTVTLVDSGELIVAASCAGVPHPPGFPLWVVLANLAAHVPLGSVAVRVNFASALCAALACGVLVLAVTELMVAYRRSIESGPKGNRTGEAKWLPTIGSLGGPL